MTAPRGFNGCYNRAPFVDATVVQDGWQDQPFNSENTTRVPLMVERPFRMEPDCQYTLTELGQADPCCIGCKWRADQKSD
jgi:hypothetical protein